MTPVIPKWLEIAEKELGVHEIPGPKSEARIVQYHSSTWLTATSDETPWCLTGDTEILTDEGWVRFDILGEQKVAQVNNGKIEFVQPIRKIEKDYDGHVFEINHASVQLICDIGHRWFGHWDGLDKLPEFRTLDLMTTAGLMIPSCHADDNEFAIEDREIQFLAAFLSDGSFKFTSNKEKPWRVQFEVSRQRKIDRLNEFKPDHVYTQNRAYGNSKSPLTCFSFAYPDFISNVCESYKVLKKSFVNSLSMRQAKLFLKEYSVFDGHQKSETGFQLYSSRENLRDDLITIALRAGFIPRVTYNLSPISGRPCWTIRYSEAKRFTYIKKEHVEKAQFKGKLYCVEVPSSLIIVRGASLTPIITGNCSAFTNWCMKQSGLKGTQSAMARSWLKWGVGLTIPAFGCIVVMSRGDNTYSGHVGFWVGDSDEANIRVLGGNQSNSVSIANFPKAKVLGYRWA